jgi:hypothetical protein
MRAQRYPVVVETWRGRSPANLSSPSNALPVEVAMALREKGWEPYRVRLDPEANAWVARVIDWGLAV